MHFSIFLHLASHERLPNRLSPTSRAAQKGAMIREGGQLPPLPPLWLRYCLLGAQLFVVIIYVFVIGTPLGII